MIGPGTGITEDPGAYGGRSSTWPGNIGMGRSLRENRAINEAQRGRVSGMLEAGRSRLPGYGTTAAPQLSTDPDAGLSGQQIAEKYNIPRQVVA